jgi:ATP-binding cassette subfamily C protein LapB
LLRLLAGLYAPQQGNVLMDKLDMRQIADDVLRQAIGYLPQDYRLINGSLRDNLLLGLPDPGDSALIAAAEETGLSNLIASHPRGIELPISEGGRGLSGGQRVLTGLTRLMIAQPSLWLLDEPTSNLDVETEARVLNALQQKVRPDATMVFVTHKLQLLGLVQRVILVANGQIVLDGPTAEVMKRLQPQQPQQQQQTAPVTTQTVGVKK